LEEKENSIIVIMISNVFAFFPSIFFIINPKLSEKSQPKIKRAIIVVLDHFISMNA